MQCRAQQYIAEQGSHHMYLLTGVHNCETGGSSAIRSEVAQAERSLPRTDSDADADSPAIVFLGDSQVNVNMHYYHLHYVNDFANHSHMHHHHDYLHTLVFVKSDAHKKMWLAL